MMERQHDRRYIEPHETGDATAPVAVRLFGPLEVRVEGNPLSEEWELPPDAASLFRWLLVHGGKKPNRRKLYRDLWPHLPVRQRQQQLDKAWSELRAWLQAHLPQVADAVPAGTDATLMFPVPGLIWTDHQAFLRHEQRVRRADIVGDARAKRLHCEAMDELYRGHLLAEIRGAEWVLLERWRLHDTYMVALARLAQLAFRRRAYHASITYCRRLIDEDPLGEGMHRLLMRCYNRLGHSWLALQHYEELRAMLKHKADAEPVAETHALYEQLRDVNSP